MSSVFVKPGVSSSGLPLVVRDPISGLIMRIEGEWKALTDFWIHRLRDGDVIQATPAAPAPAASATPPAPTQPTAAAAADPAKS